MTSEDVRKKAEQHNRLAFQTVRLELKLQKHNSEQLNTCPIWRMPRLIHALKLREEKYLAAFNEFAATPPLTRERFAEWIERRGKVRWITWDNNPAVLHEAFERATDLRVALEIPQGPRSPTADDESSYAKGMNYLEDLKQWAKNEVDLPDAKPTNDGPKPKPSREEKQRQALALALDTKRSWTAGDIAQVVKVRRTTLYKWPLVKAALKHRNLPDR
jgi:hypothetical protein